MLIRKITYIIICLLAIRPLVNGQVKFYTQVSENTVMYRHTFQAGTYRFQCDFHTNMKGEFVVSA